MQSPLHLLHLAHQAGERLFDSVETGGLTQRQYTVLAALSNFEGSIGEALASADQPGLQLTPPRSWLTLGEHAGD